MSLEEVLYVCWDPCHTRTYVVRRLSSVWDFPMFVYGNDAPPHIHRQDKLVKPRAIMTEQHVEVAVVQVMMIRQLVEATKREEATRVQRPPASISILWSWTFV
jgi:hypothetical protein